MSTTEPNSISQNLGQNAQSGGKEKEIYFIILRPIKEKVNLELKFSSEITPQRIYRKCIEKGKDSFLENNVFKLNIKKSEMKKKKKIEDYEIELIEGENAYNISFSIKENTFVYETELKKYNKWLDNIAKESIFPFYNK